MFKWYPDHQSATPETRDGEEKGGKRKGKKKKKKKERSVNNK